MGLRASACYFGSAVKIDAYSGPENNLGAGAFYTLLELTLTLDHYQSQYTDLLFGIGAGSILLTAPVVIRLPLSSTVLVAIVLFIYVLYGIQFDYIVDKI